MCLGRFSGCSAVWARGPVAVTFRPNLERRSAAEVAQPGTGRKVKAGLSDLGTFQPAETDSTPEIDTPESVDLLLAEVRSLVSALHGARPTSSTGATVDFDRTVRELTDYLDALPERIALGISSALAKQHRLLIDDIHAALQELGTQQISSTAATATEA